MTRKADFFSPKRWYCRDIAKRSRFAAVSSQFSLSGTDILSSELKARKEALSTEITQENGKNRKKKKSYESQPFLCVIKQAFYSFLSHSIHLLCDQHCLLRWDHSLKEKSIVGNNQFNSNFLINDMLQFMIMIIIIKRIFIQDIHFNK